MRIHVKLLLTALTAALVLAAGLSTASATRLSVSNQGIRIVFPHLNFGGTVVECRVTIEGTLHNRTFTKVSGSLIGYITRAIIQKPCDRGDASVLATTLPWHIRYNNFTGTLPRFTGVGLQLVGAGFQVNVGILCLYQSTAARPLFGTLAVEASGLVTNLRVDETREIPLLRGEPGCPVTGNLSGSGPVTILGGTTNIQIRLI